MKRKGSKRQAQGLQNSRIFQRELQNTDIQYSKIVCPHSQITGRRYESVVGNSRKLVEFGDLRERTKFVSEFSYVFHR